MLRVSFGIIGALSLAATLLPAACGGPDEDAVSEDDAAGAIAALVCRLRFACSCESSAEDGLTEEACREVQRARLDDAFGAARAASLTYDGACLARKLARLEARGCRTSHEIERDPEELCAMRDCSIYHGELSESAACEPAGWYSGCAPDMACKAIIGGEPGDVCERSCFKLYDRVARRGEACTDELSSQTAYCEEGTRCHFDQGVCAEPTVQAGASCADGYCVESAYCRIGPDDNGICYAKRADGEGCEGAEQCLSGGCDPSAGICVAGTPEVCFFYEI